jgi:hypothetical protein
MVGLGVLLVLAALAWPRVADRAFRGHLDRVDDVVDALHAAADRNRTTTGSWPSASAPGVLPDEIASALPDGLSLSGSGYAVSWSRWEVVDSVPSPPLTPPVGTGDAPPRDPLPALRPMVRTVGAISVHSADERLLGELLERHGRERSFVRDSVWTLVLPTRAASTR